MEPEDDSVNKFFEKHLGILITIALVIVFGGYLVYSWYFPQQMRDCDYEKYGCQGENSRFGQ